MDDARRLSGGLSVLHLAAERSLDPLFWQPERRGAASSWWGHVPFAYWLVLAVRPRLLVELGTENGVSYLAFCQAVERGQLSTRCFAVDTWAGDLHTGSYGDRIYDELRAFHDPHYAGFSSLMRTNFDAALDQFADGTIDLLHIDGFHTYEAVRHDFATWQGKLSDRAVVLFHDTVEHQSDFGVWRLWAELSPRYPHFEFHHSSGLGLLAVGSKVPAEIANLCALGDSEEADALRRRISRIGERWSLDPRTNAASGGALLEQEQLIMASTVWKLTWPLRRLGAMIPAPIRRQARTVLRWGWRAVSLRPLRDSLGHRPLAR